VPNLLMLANGVGLIAASAALWVQGQRRADHRFFAGLISIAVTLSLFSPSAGNGCKGSATLIRFNGARGSEFLTKCPRLVPVD